MLDLTLVGRPFYTQGGVKVATFFIGGWAAGHDGFQVLKVLVFFRKVGFLQGSTDSREGLLLIT